MECVCFNFLNSGEHPQHIFQGKGMCAQWGFYFFIFSLRVRVELERWRETHSPRKSTRVRILSVGGRGNGDLFDLKKLGLYKSTPSCVFHIFFSFKKKKKKKRAECWLVVHIILLTTTRDMNVQHLPHH